MSDEPHEPFELYKRDLTNSAPEYQLIAELVKWYHYYNNSIGDARERRKRIVKGLLTIFQGEHSARILSYLWEKGAVTVKELEAEFNLSKQIISHTLHTLTNVLGIAKITAIIATPGRLGRRVYVYALDVADPEASVDAQRRYRWIMLQERQRLKALRDGERPLHEEEDRLRLQALKEGMERRLERVVDEFEAAYGATGRTIDLNEVAKRCGDDLDAHEVGRRLTASGLRVWYLVGGREDPAWKPPSDWNLR